MMMKAGHQADMDEQERDQQSKTHHGVTLMIWPLVRAGEGFKYTEGKDDQQWQIDDRYKYWLGEGVNRTESWGSDNFSPVVVRLNRLVDVCSQR